MFKKVSAIFVVWAMVIGLLPVFQVAKAEEPVVVPDSEQFSFDVTVAEGELDFAIPTQGAGSKHRWAIAWGDGEETVENTDVTKNVAGVPHTYSTAGTYTITIKPTVSGTTQWLYAFGCGSATTGASTQTNKDKIVQVNGPFSPLMMRTAVDVPVNNEWQNTFGGCKQLKGLGNGAVFTEGYQQVISVGVNFLQGTFNNCTALESLSNGFNIPQAIERVVPGSFCAYLFYNCESLKTLPAGFTFPQGIDEVGDNFADCMFGGCRALESLPSGLNLPQNIVKVGNRFCCVMFSGCTALTELSSGFNLPPSVTQVSVSFADCMFLNCSALKGLPDGFNLPTGITTAPKWFATSMFNGCGGLEELPEGFNIPQEIDMNSGDSIFQSMFEKCSSLKSLPEGFNLPQGLTSVKNNFCTTMFYECFLLEQLPEGFSLPQNLLSVGDDYAYHMFYNTYNLLDLPESFKLTPFENLTNRMYVGLFACESDTKMKRKNFTASDVWGELSTEYANNAFDAYFNAGSGNVFPAFADYWSLPANLGGKGEEFVKGYANDNGEIRAVELISEGESGSIWEDKYGRTWEYDNEQVAGYRGLYSPLYVNLKSIEYLGDDEIEVGYTLDKANVKVIDVEGNEVDPKKYDLQFTINGVEVGDSYTLKNADVGKTIGMKATENMWYIGSVESEIGVVLDITADPTTKPTNPPSKPDNKPEQTDKPISTTKPTIAPSANPFKAEHMAYMKGYADSVFGADRDMTRAEAAVMLSRLMKDKGGSKAKFPDVQADKWFASAVERLAGEGIILGRGDGKFYPDSSITRAEFVALIARVNGLNSVSGGAFSDVNANYWALGAINAVADKKWIKGYADGSFRPEQSITRAEVVTIVNKMLNRHFDENEKMDLKKFVDLKSDFWAYEDIMEATNEHGHNYADGKEIWK